MKKRDFYILVLLICIVCYAASHRKRPDNVTAISVKELNNNQSKTVIKPEKIDSISKSTRKVLDAEV